MSEHPRKQPVRRSDAPRIARHHASLQTIRDGLLPASEASTVAPAGATVSATVPAALLAAVDEHARHANTYWSRATQVGRQYSEAHAEWQRLVLYHLTDALAHNHLVIGTIAAYLQQHGIDEDLLRRHLQSPDADRYVNRPAIDHLAGLLGPHRDADGPEPAWTYVGREIARRTQS